MSRLSSCFRVKIASGGKKNLFAVSLFFYLHLLKTVEVPSSKNVPSQLPGYECTQVLRDWPLWVLWGTVTIQLRRQVPQFMLLQGHCPAQTLPRLTAFRVGSQCLSGSWHLLHQILQHHLTLGTVSQTYSDITRPLDVLDTLLGPLCPQVTSAHTQDYHNTPVPSQVVEPRNRPGILSLLWAEWSKASSYSLDPMLLFICPKAPVGNCNPELIHSPKA